MRGGVSEARLHSSEKRLRAIFCAAKNKRNLKPQCPNRFTTSINSCKTSINRCTASINRCTTSIYRCTTSIHRCTTSINRCTTSINRCTTSNKEEVVRRPPLAASVRSRGELTNTNTNSDERKHAHAPVYTEIYMRGRWIFHHVISHLLLKQGLADATAAILTGCSSGALGVFTLRTYVSSGCNRRHTH